MTTNKQDQNFISELIPSRLLEKAIEWIKSNMSPEDVFDKSELENWASDNSDLNYKISELEERWSQNN